MLFYSTNKKSPEATLKEAVLQGLADDNGLYMPHYIIELPQSFYRNIHTYSLQQIAFQVTKTVFLNSLSTKVLNQIIDDSLDFDTPLVNVHEDVYALELFHGPTLAFKDVGARFMARLMAHLTKDEDREITVLVATSGDTGSAVASGFLGVSGVKVVIFYPSGKVSDIQEKQLTTLGQNITALEVDGTFDDCQKLVKQAFLDDKLRKKLMLTSANSINIARLIPQSFYYFYAYGRIEDAEQRKIAFSVPSGNFGNLTGGLIAKQMGLPVYKFIAATNVNDVVPQYLESGEFEPAPSKKTISNAMDVGNPSNFARIMDLYQHHHEKISSDIEGYSYTDDQTRQAMKEVHEKYGYVLDPHGAVAYAALKDYMKPNNGVTGIFLETAHPAKFKHVVEEVLDDKIKLPDRLESAIKKEKHAVRLENSYNALRTFLLAHR